MRNITAPLSLSTRHHTRNMQALAGLRGRGRRKDDSGKGRTWEEAIGNVDEEKRENCIIARRSRNRRETVRKAESNIDRERKRKVPCMKLGIQC